MPGKPRVVIAAGGTAGHVVPALAIADALRASGAEVDFLGTRERAEAELVPAAGYEIDFVRSAASTAAIPLRAAARRVRGAGAAAPRARAAAPRRRRRAGRRRLRRRSGRAGGGARADAAGADRGRQPPRAGQPAAGAAGAAGLPRLPDRRSRRRPLPGDRAADPGRDRRRRPRARHARASGSPPTSAACWSSAAASARARSTTPRSRRSPSARGRDSQVAASLAAGATTSELEADLTPLRTPALHLLRLQPDLADVLAAGRPRPRPLRRLGLRGGRGRQAGDPRAVPARDRRPPDANAA